MLHMQMIPKTLRISFLLQSIDHSKAAQLRQSRNVAGFLKTGYQSAELIFKIHSVLRLLVAIFLKAHLRLRDNN